MRDSAWIKASGMPIAKDGTIAFFRWVIRKKGQVDLGDYACAMCHTRVMPDGTLIKGAQGNFPFGSFKAHARRASIQTGKDPAEVDRVARRVDFGLYSAAWIKPDPLLPMSSMSFAQFVDATGSIPAGVQARHRASFLYPVQVPDLIGVKDRHYLDRTGLQRHRSIADLMRYAAMNQGADDLADYSGFIQAAPDFKHMPEPDSVGGRYSDEQLYALALYVYSLRAPVNPNPTNKLAAAGQQVFNHAGCGGCHTAPLYTNNRLTPAVGVTPTQEEMSRVDILPVTVGTDSGLTTKTRRGTGYYKVPSLKGVWYRAMFGHSGWCATLEDWFNPMRLRQDYVPTGFRPYGSETYAVRGHEFGLELPERDRRALIAFLRTL